MELECQKYGEKMKADEAVCRHPGDYCKYRTSCVIHFMHPRGADDRDAPVEEDIPNSATEENR